MLNCGTLVWIQCVTFRSPDGRTSVSTYDPLTGSATGGSNGIGRTRLAGIGLVVLAQHRTQHEERSADEQQRPRQPDPDHLRGGVPSERQARRDGATSRTEGSGGGSDGPQDPTERPCRFGFCTRRRCRFDFGARAAAVRGRGTCRRGPVVFVAAGRSVGVFDCRLLRPAGVASQQSSTAASSAGLDCAPSSRQARCRRSRQPSSRQASIAAFFAESSSFFDGGVFAPACSPERCAAAAPPSRSILVRRSRSAAGSSATSWRSWPISSPAPVGHLRGASRTGPRPACQRPRTRGIERARRRLLGFAHQSVLAVGLATAVAVTTARF